MSSSAEFRRWRRREGKAALVVLWELRDPSGQRLGERAERLEAPADDWDAGNEDAVARLAAASAAQLAALLQDEAPSEAEIGGRTRLVIGAVAGAPGDGGAVAGQGDHRDPEEAGSGDRHRSAGQGRSRPRRRCRRRQAESAESRTSRSSGMCAARTAARSARSGRKTTSRPGCSTAPGAMSPTWSPSRRRTGSCSSSPAARRSRREVLRPRLPLQSCGCYNTCE